MVLKNHNKWNTAYKDIMSFIMNYCQKCVFKQIHIWFWLIVFEPIISQKKQNGKSTKYLSLCAKSQINIIQNFAKFSIYEQIKKK